MKILDLSAGNRAIWLNKAHPLAVFLDKRPEVKPTIVCDTCRIPEIVGDGYDLIVWDPPHTNCGPNSHMSKRYGHSKTEEILDLVEKTSKEAHRVSTEKAILAFKWSDHTIKLERILPLMNQWEPLFGHLVKNGSGTKHRKEGSKTQWLLFIKRELNIFE